MPVSVPAPFFTCDCCGQREDSLTGTYVTVAVPSGDPVTLCLRNGCADGIKAKVKSFHKKEYAAHQAAIAGGVIPPH